MNDFRIYELVPHWEQLILCEWVIEEAAIDAIAVQGMKELGSISSGNENVQGEQSAKQMKMKTKPNINIFFYKYTGIILRSESSLFSLTPS